MYHMQVIMIWKSYLHGLMKFANRKEKYSVKETVCKELESLLAYCGIL